MLFLNKDIAVLDRAAFHSSSCNKSQGQSEKTQGKSSFLMCQYSLSRAAGVATSEQVKVPSGIPLPRALKTNPNPTNCHKEITKETSGPNGCGCGK